MLTQCQKKNGQRQQKDKIPRIEKGKAATVVEELYKQRHKQMSEGLEMERVTQSWKEQMD